MIPILIAFGSSEGQTRKIAEFMAEVLFDAGYHADLVDTAAPQSDVVQPVYAAALIGGPVHAGRHPASLARFVAANREWLATVPVAFFSVSLTAAHRDVHSRAETRRMMDEFLGASGLEPARAVCFAGALRYSRYGWFKRLLMRRIARKEGGDTDTARDHEYTDWRAIRQFALDFARDHVGIPRRVA